MNNNLFKNDKYYNLFSCILLLTISFLIIEIGVNLTIYNRITPYKVTLILITLMFFIAFIKTPKNIFSFSLNAIKIQLKEVKVLIILILIYITFDLLSLFHTNNKFLGLTKYVTIVSMITIVFFYLLFLNKDKSNNTLNILLTFISMPSVVISLYTWFYFFIFKTTYYTRRLSLIQDYNKFSILILFSFIALLYLIFRTIRNLNRRNLLLSISTVLCAPTIHLTASRRSAKMLNIILVLICIYGIYDTYVKLSTISESKPSKNSFIKGLIKFFITISITYVVSVFVMFSYIYFTDDMILEATQSEQGEGISVNKGTEEILGDQEALSKRETIWDIAIKSYKDYPLINKLIGKGSSSHIDIYNIAENQERLNKIYWYSIPKNTLDPHNFLLVDLLNGGILLVLITILCLLSIMKLLFKIFKNSIVDAVFIFILSITILGDIFISARNGIFDNKYVWIILILLITTFNNIRNKKVTT